jgi:hypothetical protein
MLEKRFRCKSRQDAVPGSPAAADGGDCCILVQECVQMEAAEEMRSRRWRVRVTFTAGAVGDAVHPPSPTEQGFRSAHFRGGETRQKH